jgi:hypothetical protein
MVAAIKAFEQEPEGFGLDEEGKDLKNEEKKENH